jgi:hypothetical protein
MCKPRCKLLLATEYNTVYEMFRSTQAIREVCAVLTQSDGSLLSCRVRERRHRKDFSFTQFHIQHNIRECGGRGLDVVLQDDTVRVSKVKIRLSAYPSLFGTFRNVPASFVVCLHRCTSSTPLQRPFLNPSV